MKKFNEEKGNYIRIALWMSMRRLKVYEKGIFETEKKTTEVFLSIRLRKRKV